MPSIIGTPRPTQSAASVSSLVAVYVYAQQSIAALAAYLAFGTKSTVRAVVAAGVIFVGVGLSARAGARAGASASA
jgi:hypothetical protein